MPAGPTSLRALTRLARIACHSLAILAIVAASLFVVAGPARADGENGGPAIWKATRGDAIVYLFGTIHILEPGKNWFTAKIKSRFDAAHTLALEMADIRGRSAEAGRLIRELGAYPPRDSLANHVGERTYMRLQSTMSRLGTPPAALYRMRPWVALMVFNTHALAADGKLLDYGADRKLHRMAIAQTKRVIGLETMEAHLRTFADMPDAVQVEMLTASLNSLNKNDPTYMPLVNSWITGDVEELGRLIESQMAQASPIFRESLLGNRNRNWIRPIERMLHGSGIYFVAAGAGHFTGDDNVIVLLKARGVNVVRE